MKEHRYDDGPDCLDCGCFGPIDDPVDERTECKPRVTNNEGTGDGQVIGSITGRLDNLNGASATILIVSQESGTRRAIETDDVGSFRCEMLPAGPYQVTYLAKGFKIKSEVIHIVNSFPLVITREMELDPVLRPKVSTDDVIVVIKREKFNQIVTGLAEILKILGEGKA